MLPNGAILGEDELNLLVDTLYVHKGRSIDAAVILNAGDALEEIAKGRDKKKKSKLKVKSKRILTPAEYVISGGSIDAEVLEESADILDVGETSEKIVLDALVHSIFRGPEEAIQPPNFESNEELYKSLEPRWRDALAEIVDLSAEQYCGHFRKIKGSNYFLHPLYVAQLRAQTLTLGDSPFSVVASLGAALLHDGIEEPIAAMIKQRKKRGSPQNFPDQVVHDILTERDAQIFGEISDMCIKKGVYIPTEKDDLKRTRAYQQRVSGVLNSAKGRDELMKKLGLTPDQAIQEYFPLVERYVETLEARIRKYEKRSIPRVDADIRKKLSERLGKVEGLSPNYVKHLVNAISFPVRHVLTRLGGIPYYEPCAKPFDQKGNKRLRRAKKEGQRVKFSDINANLGDVDRREYDGRLVEFKFVPNGGNAGLVDMIREINLLDPRNLVSVRYMFNDIITAWLESKDYNLVPVLELPPELAATQGGRMVHHVVYRLTGENRKVYEEIGKQVPSTFFSEGYQLYMGTIDSKSHLSPGDRLHVASKAHLFLPFERRRYQGEATPLDIYLFEQQTVALMEKVISSALNEVFSLYCRRGKPTRNRFDLPYASASWVALRKHEEEGGLKQVTRSKRGDFNNGYFERVVDQRVRGNKKAISSFYADARNCFRGGIALLRETAWYRDVPGHFLRGITHEGLDLAKPVGGRK